MPKRFTQEEVARLQETFRTASPEDVLRWGLETLGRSAALAWSGAEDVAILDMMHRIDAKSLRVFLLDTGRLNPETYELVDVVRRQYGIQVEVVFPEAAAVEAMVREKGVNLFYHSLENRQECCRIRKVEPLGRILRTLEGWITGQRRAQSVTRSTLEKIELDAAHGDIVKLNPLADWTTAQVFDYLKSHRVPKNKLHDLGYPSIGCAPCTRAIRAGEDERAGRWWWENPESKECGLHVPRK
jgi:phosphoadenosine phosphosulfate reductase